MIPLIIQDQFDTIQNLQRSPIPQTSNWQGTFFFAVSYSKPALVKYCVLTSLSVFLSETQNRGVRLNPQQSLCLLMLANLYF